MEFTPEAGGAAKTIAGPPPPRPGAFRVEETPPARDATAGRCLVDAPDLSDRHDLGSVTVFADEADRSSRRTSAAADDPAAIAI